MRAHDARANGCKETLKDKQANDRARDGRASRKSHSRPWSPHVGIRCGPSFVVKPAPVEPAHFCRQLQKRHSIARPL